MLQATRRGSFRPSFDIVEGGRRVTTLENVTWQSCGFFADGYHFQILHESRNRLTLAGPAGYLASAEMPFASTEWTINSSVGRWELALRSMWDATTWELRRSGHAIGAVWWERRKKPSIADLPADIPLPLRVFVHYLALYSWEQAVNRQR